MPIALGQFVIDESLVAKQLKQDFRDDWFPDPLGYVDYFDKGLIAQIIEKNFDQNNGEYRPARALLLNIPKANFTLRYALETGLTDRTVYHALAASLLRLYDPLISWRVFSHRSPNASQKSEENRSDSKYIFRNGVFAWNDFIGCVRSKMVEGKILLSTDLANYFENINLSLLKDRMIEMVPELSCETAAKAEARQQVAQLFTYLSSWTYTEERGLPQNRDASSFLANLYMRKVDEAMIGGGYEYFRYMDDIKIVCDDEGAARKALKHLVLELRDLGLSVNSGKTHIVLGDNKDKISECLGTASHEIKRINSAWKTRSLKPIARSFLALKNLTIKTLQNNQYDSREFRFCIGRLETLARCVEFNVPAEYFREITELVIDGLDRSPVSTDQICRYLLAVDVSDEQISTIFEHLRSPQKSIYNWKNYRLWLLLAQKKFNSEEAKDLARRIVCEPTDNPTRAGATIYLGMHGAPEDRELIAKNFHSLTSFLGQRSAVIGSHEVHFKAKGGREVCIRDHVGPHIRPDLLGSYKALNRAGTYVSEPEPVQITQYVDLERDYD